MVIFFGIIAVGELLLIFQAILGLVLVLQGFRPPRAFLHFLYGTFALLVIPSVYYYTRGDEQRRAALTWFFVGLFMVGLSLRLLGMRAFL